MRKVAASGFDIRMRRTLKRKPHLRERFAKKFAELPLPAQLGIMRRRRQMSQETVARKMRVRQSHVARTERHKHNPRISSVLSEAKALRCHVLIVPQERLSKIARIVAVR